MWESEFCGHFSALCASCCVLLFYCWWLLQAVLRIRTQSLIKLALRGQEMGKQMWSHVQYAWKHGRALGVTAFGILRLHLLNPKPICRYFQWYAWFQMTGFFLESYNRSKMKSNLVSSLKMWAIGLSMDLKVRFWLLQLIGMWSLVWKIMHQALA
jgi:hypothetical protein